MNRKADSIVQVINLDGSSCAQPSAHSLSHIPGIQGEPASRCAHTQHGTAGPLLSSFCQASPPNTSKMSKSFYYIAAVKEQQLMERNS